jgi:hypothetical protein
MVMRKHSPYIVILILSTALILSLEKCSYVKNKNIANITGFTDTVKYFKNKLGTQTAEIKILQLNKEQLQRLILNKDKELNLLAKEFSKVNTIIKYKTLIQFDTLRIDYKDTIPCIFKRSGKVKENWYSFTYASDQKGITIDSLKTYTETTIINGFKRKWFLGNETVTTNITNSNPYLKVAQIKSAEVVVPEPWYKKWYVWLAVGVSAGFISSQ